MNTFIKLMEDKIVPIAGKVSSNKYLKSISAGSMSLLAIIMVGAIFSIFTNISWEPYNNFMASYGLDRVVEFIPQVTTNLLAIYMAFSIAYNGANNFDNGKYAFSSGILSLVCFMLLVPLNTEVVEGMSIYDVNYLGTRGIFVAIITGLVVARLLAFVIKRDIRIKMPEGVPPIVSESFSALIAAIIILLVFVIVKVGFENTSYGCFNDFIYKIIQTPLQALTGNLSAFLICVVLAQILWFFGVHGSFTILPIMIPIWLGFMGENQAAIAAGNGIPNPLNIGMWDLANLGGSGATIGLVILMFFFAKSKQFKSFSRVAFPCGIFSVNEPVIFGTPIILNPIMLIPFVICPVVLVILGYILIKFGIVVAPIGMLGVGSMPPLISGIMQGSVSWGIFQLVAVIISVVIYYPFFKIIDRQALENEQNSEAEVNA